MNEGKVSLLALVSCVLWAIVGGLIAATWVAVSRGSDPVAQALGFSACAGSAVAATVTIRCYMCRVCSLLRTLHGIEGERPRVPELHSLRT